MRRVALLAVILSSILLSTAPGFGATRYMATFLGNGFIPHAVNNKGQVVGELEITASQYHAALWNSGALKDLGTLPYGSESHAEDINDAGQVVGRSSTYGPGGLIQHAFLWQNNQWTDLTGPGSSLTGEATGINNAGQIVGRSGPSNGMLGCIWQSNSISMLQDSTGRLDYGIAVNESGTVLGASDGHTKVWKDGAIQDLGTLNGSWTYPWAINGSGDVAGYSSVSGSTHYRAFARVGGVWTDLGNGEAYGINDSGMVVGSSLDAIGSAGNCQALIWENGARTDLNTLIDSSAGWTLSSATGINSLGQIIGQGSYNGVPGGFLLTPVPEPSSLLALVCGLASVGAMLRFRRK